MIFSSIFIKMAKIDTQTTQIDNQGFPQRLTLYTKELASINNYNKEIVNSSLNEKMREICFSNPAYPDFKSKVDNLYPQYPELGPLQAFINNDNNEQFAMKDNSDSVSKNGVA